jgi:hypothetical protein
VCRRFATLLAHLQGSKGAAPTALEIIVIATPALPGWADVWRAALRALTDDRWYPTSRSSACLLAVTRAIAGGLVVETERELHLPGRIGIRGGVGSEARTIGYGAIGLLEVGGIEDVEGFDTELELARFRPQ